MNRLLTPGTRRVLCVALTLVALAATCVNAQAQDTAPPRLVTPVEPAIPEQALEDGLESASVGLVLYIDETGTLVKVEVETPSEWPEFYGFEQAAIAAVEAATFEPAVRDGQPVPARIRYTVEFAPPQIEIPEDFLVRAYNIGVALDDRIYTRFRELQAEARAAWEAQQPPPPLSMTGTVYERGTRTLLPGVLIAFTRDPDADGEPDEVVEVYSDDEGRFEVRGLEPGTWQITISEEKFGTYETEEEFVAGEVVEVDYYVERLYYDEYGTDGAYVYETRERRLRKEVNRRTLDVAEITKIPGNQGDALKVVQNLPGVARSSFNLGQIIVRGSAPEDTQVLLDGTPIPLLYHFGGLTSVVPSEILKSIDFYPGNFSSRYGRATGGVLDVRTRPPRKDRWGGYADIDVIDASFFIEGPITEDVSVQASARRSYFDAFLPYVIPDDVGGDLLVAPRYWDYQARINWDVGKGHELELQSYGSDDVLEFVLDEPNPQNPFVRGNLEAGTAFHRGKLTWNWRGDKIQNRFSYDTGISTLNFNLDDNLNFNLDVYQHNFREEIEIEVNDKLTLITGLDILLGLYTIDFRLPDFLREGEFVGGFETRRFVELTEDGTNYQPATFVEAELRPIQELLLIIGGRVDYDRLIDAFNADLRGALRYDILDDLTLKAGVGRFSQPPQAQETNDLIGNPDLGWEHSMHYAVGAEYRLPFYEPLLIDVTGFYKTFDDLVTDSDDVVERNGRTVPENLNNDGVGTARGVELLVRHDLANNFFGWIAYTVSEATRADAPGEELRPFDFDQTHILTILGSYKLPHQWQVGLRWRYVTGQPFTPETGAVFDADADNFRPLDGERNSARIEDFHQLDLRVDKSFVFDTWILSLYLDIQNVYYHANPESVTYNYDSTQRSFVTGLPILPSFGIKGEF